MQGRAPGLIDWKTASAIGRSFTGSGPTLSADERGRMRETIASSVAEAAGLVVDNTGLRLSGPSPRAWTMSRGEWIEANFRSLERTIEPMVVRTIAAQGGRRGSAVRSRTLAAQIGGLFGYVSRKVLGQFDPFLPPDDEGLIYFVGPNVAEAERRFAFDQDEFRLWIALHEVTHRVQFSAAPWLRGHILTSIDSYLSMTQLDLKRTAENLARALNDLRSGGELRTLGVIYALMTPEQRRLFHRMQATMSLVEGHASFVMNTAGSERLTTLERMREALRSRRNVGNLERTFQQAIGFDHKVQQYGTGERFVAEVVERAGMDAFNAVWTTPGNLPTTEEIAEPAIWLSRVHR